MKKPKLDKWILSKFTEYFEKIDEDGTFHFDSKFLQCFPSRREQARDFIGQVVKEVVVPYAKEVIAEKGGTDEA